MITIDGGTGKIMHNGLNVAAAPMVDQWRITDDGTLSQSSVDVFSSNWERVDDATIGFVGTGMSESSGIFTFPSTGFWQVSMKVNIEASNDPTAELSMKATDDNSSYSQIMSVTAGTRAAAGATYFNIDTAVILDIEDVSTDKIKFATDSLATNSTIYGNSAGSATAFTFIRLADT